MKLNLKNILLIVLSCMCVYLFFNKNDNSNFKKEKKELIKKVKMLENKDDSLSKERILLNKKYFALEEKYKTDSLKNDSLNRQLNLINKELIKSEKIANYYLNKLSNIKDKVNETEKNPTYKKGDNLIKSLTEKIN